MKTIIPIKTTVKIVNGGCYDGKLGKVVRHRKYSPETGQDYDCEVEIEGEPIAQWVPFSWEELEKQ